MSANNMSYNKMSVRLHWLMAGLIILMLIVGALMGYIPDSKLSLKIMVYNWHKTIGMLILLLAIVRIIWRLMHKAPPLPSYLKTWEVHLARLVHFLFYLFMIAMPLVGWALVSTSKFPSFLFNVKALKLPALPFWQGLDKAHLHEVHEFFEESHETLAILAVVLLVLHVAGAVKHMRSDQTYALRMMPWRAKKDA